MIKRYDIAICDFYPVGTASVRDIKPSIYCNETPGGTWVEYDDIKDSLIEWHKIEDGLPEANDLPVIVEHKDPGYWRKHPYEILTGATVIRRAFTYKRWTYIIPPKE